MDYKNIYGLRIMYAYNEYKDSIEETYTDKEIAYLKRNQYKRVQKENSK